MSDFGTAATAIATVLLGGATVWLGWTTRSAVHESVRSRLDTGAPKIAVLLDEPDWPPYTTSGSFGVDIQALDTMMNQRLDSKQYETLSVLVVANGTLINEGSSLAVIALDSAETDHSHLDFFDHGIIVCPRHGIPAPAMTVTPDPGRPPGPRPLGDGRYPLPAGERAQFRLQVGMTASEWFSAFERRELDANAGKMTLTITVSGQLAEGPLDQISMEIRAFPILPRQQSDGWFIPGRSPIPGPGGSDAATRQSFLELTKRTYPRLGRRRR